MERIKALESIEPDVISYNSLVYALVQEPWVFEASDSPRRILPKLKMDAHVLPTSVIRTDKFC